MDKTLNKKRRGYKREDSMEFKKVGILGLGALGILYGEKLSRVLGKDLYILVDGKRKERYIKEGVFSNGEKLDFNYLDYETEEADLDLIIVAFNFNLSLFYL